FRSTWIVRGKAIDSHIRRLCPLTCSVQGPRNHFYTPRMCCSDKGPFSNIKSWEKRMDILLYCLICRSGHLMGKNEPCQGPWQDLRNSLENRRMKGDNPDRGYCFTNQNGTDLHLGSRLLDLDKKSAYSSH